MSRPCVLLFLLFLIVLTSHFEWKQQFGNEVEQGPNDPRKEQLISKREDTVKEKIILFQEKNIQKLKDFVQTLQEQLIKCRDENEVNGSTHHLTDILSDIERQPMLED